jgi:prepilin-type N-terminal cleavage/methylation domain-containing protein
MKNGNKGFTLIELLVVIAIIGLLSTLAVVALNSARQKSRDSKRVADTKQIQTALELYFADNNRYPDMATNTELGSSSTNKLCGSGTFAGTCTGTTYMGLVPSKPTPNDGSCDSTENRYMYESDSPNSDYTLTFCLGGTVGDLTAGLHTANPNGIQ